MRPWLASPAQRRLLPEGRLHGPTPWVLAIMMFVSISVAAAALSLANGARLVAAGAERGYSIEVEPGPAGLRPAQGTAIIAALPGVRKVDHVSDADIRRTLANWIGEATARSLPLPQLYEVILEPGGQEAFETAARMALPGSRLVAHSGQVAPVLSSMRALIWLAWGMVALMAAATAAAVVMATRGALDTHRFTIEVMHGIGATDRQIAALFQRRIAIDALTGCLSGAAAAGVVLALILGGSAALIGELAGAAPLEWSDALLLAAMPLAGAGLATLAARIAVLRALRQSL